MSNIELTVSRWISNEKNLSTQLSNCNVFADGDTIYSYGRHFPMAHLIRDGGGRIVRAVVNGDRYSVSTSQHQSLVRGGLYLAKVPFILVPFESLDAAGIDPKSVVPVDVKQDGVEYVRHSGEEPPKGMEDMGQLQGGMFGGEYRSDASNAVGILRGMLVRKIDGRFVWHSRRHWLGDSVFKATAITYLGFDHDGAHYAEREAYYISSFDRQESRPLYFLSELPHPVSTLEDAIESLKPEAVVTAESMGREVTRQGDMFAVPTGVTTRQIKAMGGSIVKRKGPKREWQETTCNFSQGGDHGFIPAVKAVDFTGDWTRYTSLGERSESWARSPRTHAMPTTVIKPAFHRVETAQATGIPLYGTAHTATEVAELPDGTMLARGTMYHQPWIVGERWREADHARRRIGDGKAWHVIAKNTVPTVESIQASNRAA